VRQVAGATPDNGGGSSSKGGKKGKKKSGNTQDYNGQQLNKMVKRAKKKNCKC
jgi:hypothetical protein